MYKLDPFIFYTQDELTSLQKLREEIENSEVEQETRLEVKSFCLPTAIQDIQNKEIEKVI